MNTDCCEAMRKAIETLRKHGIELPHLLCEFDHSPPSNGRAWCAGCGIELKQKGTCVNHEDPALKKIDEGLQAIRDMSTLKKEEPRCPKCQQPVDNVIHFCPKA